MHERHTVRTRPLRRSSVAVALMGLVLVVLVPLAPASAATTISISRGTVIGGESITVKGTLGQRKARQVVLQRKVGTRWIAVISKRSTAAGGFTFRYKPPTKSPSRTVIRVVAPRTKIAGRTFKQITTGGRTVLTVGQGASVSMPATTPRDETFRITGTFTPARTGRTVVAQKPNGTGGWVSVGTPAKQSSAGKVSIPMVLKVQGVYSFRVLALASGGAAAVASLPLSIEVGAPVSAPPVPSGLNAVSGDGSAQLSWNAVSAPDLAGYHVYRRTSTNEPWVKVGTNAANDTTYTAEPLTNGLTFLFSVTAFDNDGNESNKSASAVASPVEPVDTTPPPVPTNLVAAPGNTSVQLSWNAVAPDGLAGYHVYRATSASGPWTRLTTDTTPSTNYSASLLVNGTTYFFAVTSVDNSPAANESNRSSVVAATPQPDADQVPPPVPTGVSAEPGNASVTVSWTAVAADDLAGYRISRSTSASGPFGNAQTVDAPATSLEVNGLTNGTTYYFVVSSIDTSDNVSAPSTAASAVPQAGATVWSSVSAGSDHTCAIRSDGSLWCWGRNSFGQLGSAADIITTTPARVGGLSTWTAVSAGDRFTCAVRSGGTLWCWGRNLFGQSGGGGNLGTETDNATPVQLGSATTWTAVSTGDSSACGLQGGTLWCWGLNLDGQLGVATHVNTTTPNPAPTQVGAEATWTGVSVGAEHACGTRSGNALWCWGTNLDGQLGRTDNAVANPAPTQVAGAWSTVSAGGRHTCAVKTDATAWCWGNNPHGELGKGANAAANPIPAKISGDGWSSISAGGDHTCAVKTNGTAWCWGRNQFGQLGKAANGVPNPEPAQVAGAWSTVDAGSEHTAATTPTGTILTWGSNQYGQLGTATNAETATPNPAPGQVPVP